MRLVTVAHGTRSTAGNAVARDITAEAGRLLGLPATAAYVELCSPSLDEVLASSAEPTVVVPLLLSTGHHVRHDLPASIASAAGPVSLAAHLGPHAALARAQADRLRRGGARPGQRVVMVAAGSRDPGGMADLDVAARLLAETWRGPVSLATLGGLGTPPEQLVGRGVAVSPYLLAEGHFADRLRERCRAAAMAAGVIGGHPALAILVAERVRDALAEVDQQHVGVGAVRGLSRLGA
jgi:sirohydrochlorin ferrochelatase